MSTETQIEIPKTPEDELKLLIGATSEVYKWGKVLKADPLKALYRDGQLEFDFIMNELELINKKQSKLPASKRQAIVSLVKAAWKAFERRQVADKAPSIKDDIIEQKIEGND